MNSSSTYRVFYLLNLLIEKDCTKNEILDEFLKNDIKLTGASINNYINRLLSNGFNIKIKSKKKSNIYHLEKPEKKLKFLEDEIKNLNEIKKVLIAQKDYDKIRRFIVILYKFVLYIENPEIAGKFFDFGYYSTINWNLVIQLEKHCKNKDLIEIDYVLPSGENKNISIYANSIHIAEWSDRLYLWGVFKNAKQISYLPVDRIFMVNKVEKEKPDIDFEADRIRYIISNDLYKEIELDKQEKLIKLTKNYATIERFSKDEFYLVQRLLSFCPDLYYISNKKIKNLVVEKLKQIEAMYKNEYEK